MTDPVTVRSCRLCNVGGVRGQSSLLFTSDPYATVSFGPLRAEPLTDRKQHIISFL